MRGAFELSDGFGFLFKNKKDGVASRPDWAGDVKVGGKVMRLSAWVKQGKKGEYLSVKIDDGRIPVPGRESIPKPESAPRASGDIAPGLLPAGRQREPGDDDDNEVW